MLNLMYITNRSDVAEIADKNGVDIIFVDLEKIGKIERQRSWNSLISNHIPTDVITVKNAIKNASVLVRINSLYNGSKEEIDKIIKYGADMIMLPYFKTAKEVKEFVKLVDGRAEVCILLETKDAVEHIDEILNVPGIDMVHIGLNDLSHSYNSNFLFEMFPAGTVDYIVKKLKEHGIKKYGIGGIAKINHGLIPAEDVIAEHYRLGSQYTILSRAFCNVDSETDMAELEKTFRTEVKRIRQLEKEVAKFDDSMFAYCKERFNNKVEKVVSELNQRKRGTENESSDNWGL